MTYYYVPRLRPASRYTLPYNIEWKYYAVSNWLVDMLKLGTNNPHTGEPWKITEHKYGIIVLNRELTEYECESFDLSPEPVKIGLLELYHISELGVKVIDLRRDILSGETFSVDSIVIFQNKVYTWDNTTDTDELSMCQVNPNLVFVI